MDATLISFGLIEIDGRRFEHDVVLEGASFGDARRQPPKPIETGTAIRRSRPTRRSHGRRVC